MSRLGICQEQMSLDWFLYTVVSKDLLPTLQTDNRLLRINEIRNCRSPARNWIYAQYWCWIWFLNQYWLAISKRKMAYARLWKCCWRWDIIGKIFVMLCIIRDLTSVRWCWNLRWKTRQKVKLLWSLKWAGSQIP